MRAQIPELKNMSSVFRTKKIESSYMDLNFEVET